MSRTVYIHSYTRPVRIIVYIQRRYVYMICTYSYYTSYKYFLPVATPFCLNIMLALIFSRPLTYRQKEHHRQVRGHTAEALLPRLHKGFVCNTFFNRTKALLLYAPRRVASSNSAMMHIRTLGGLFTRGGPLVIILVSMSTKTQLETRSDPQIM